METNKVISNETCEEPRNAVVTCSNSFNEFSWAFVYLNNTFQCSIKDLTSKHASLQQADGEVNELLLDAADNTIKLLENFKQQYLNHEKGSLNHKRLSDLSANRDSGISSARGSFRTSQCANVHGDNACLKSHVDPDLKASQRKALDDKDAPKRKGMVFEFSDPDVETGCTLDDQQQSLVLNNVPELYQLFATTTKESKMCYQFVPFENMSVSVLTRTCLSSDTTYDEKSESDKKQPKSTVLASKVDREAVCKQWQATHQTTGIKTRMALSDCNLSSSRNDDNADRRPYNDRKTRTDEEDTVLKTTTPDANVDEETKFYLDQQATNGICDDRAEMYCPSLESAENYVPNSNEVNLLKSWSSKSLPSKLDNLTVEFDFHRSESTTSLTSHDIAERYRLEVQLSESTFALYELQLSDTLVDNTARKHIAADQSENVGTEKDAAAENHSNMKEKVNEENTEIPEVDPLNNLSKHSNEENNGQSLSASDSDSHSDILRLKLVKK